MTLSESYLLGQPQRWNLSRCKLYISRGVEGTLNQWKLRQPWVETVTQNSPLLLAAFHTPSPQNTWRLSPCGSSCFQAGHLPSHTPHLRQRPWDLVLVRAPYRSWQLEECLLTAGSSQSYLLNCITALLAAGQVDTRMSSPIRALSGTICSCWRAKPQLDTSRWAEREAKRFPSDWWLQRCDKC